MEIKQRCLVTGAAGFIGSHLCERLLADGCEVIGLDAFTDYYDPSVKRANASTLASHGNFQLAEVDLLTADLRDLLTDVGTIFHLAGQPGVRASWGESFVPYLERNVLATQRLLEAARTTNLARFVYASSSSIYGDAPEFPTRETSLPAPVSPYGVTKLAAEHLCTLYAALGVPTVSLRYFTVYGPRQRPDMAFSRFIRWIQSGDEIHLNGDGEQTRDFTYVSDIVAANVSAAMAPLESVVGRAYNLGGGSRVTVNKVIELLGRILDKEPVVNHRPAPPGEARHTFADTRAARHDLGWEPRHSLEQGLRAECEWLRTAGLA